MRLKWKRQWGGSDRVVWINVRKLNVAWSRDGEDYLPPGDAANHHFGQWLRQYGAKEKADMPHVGLWDQVMSFTDGRHRFAWCRDNGVRHLPVTVESRKQSALFQRLFGTTARVCEVPRGAFRQRV